MGPQLPLGRGTVAPLIAPQRRARGTPIAPHGPQYPSIWHNSGGILYPTSMARDKTSWHMAVCGGRLNGTLA